MRDEHADACACAKCKPIKDDAPQAAKAVAARLQLVFPVPAEPAPALEAELARIAAALNA